MFPTAHLYSGRTHLSSGSLTSAALSLLAPRRAHSRTCSPGLSVTPSEPFCLMRVCLNLAGVNSVVMNSDSSGTVDSKLLEQNFAYTYYILLNINNIINKIDCLLFKIVWIKMKLMAFKALVI